MNDKKTFRDLIEDWMVEKIDSQRIRIYRILANEIDSEDVLMNIHTFRELESASEWEISGKLPLNLEQIVDMCLRHYRKRDPQKELLRTGVYVAFLFPLIWIGDYPFKNLLDKTKGIIMFRS